ncbi:hypothetical protein AcV5_003858 [Taiwanofungus camphoratus]|nr:hypothetical protein AcV5_003858 [Antrodia cinnamomea]
MLSNTSSNTEKPNDCHIILDCEHASLILRIASAVLFSGMGRGARRGQLAGNHMMLNIHGRVKIPSVRHVHGQSSFLPLTSRSRLFPPTSMPCYLSGCQFEWEEAVELGRRDSTMH